MSKHLKTFLLALTLTTGLFISQAQIAHINSEQLVQAMPETIAMGEELKRIGQEYDTDYKTQVQELQTKAAKYQEEAATKSNEINGKRQQEISELQQKLQLYLRTAQEELQKKEFELLKPIIEKAQKAIQDIATEKAVKYVLDSSPGKGLIVFDGEDLMVAVKAKLGI
ncbi:MAG: OmpH family outer membrane protein [Flavobacteriaceae bacterium]|nr:OmpH family outer membrane protein [Flavobacteriaceae bacterium]